MTLEKELVLFEEALEKIRDPRKRHKEPDAYTELGCVMSIANEVLEKIRAERHLEARLPPSVSTMLDGCIIEENETLKRKLADSQANVDLLREALEHAIAQPKSYICRLEGLSAARLLLNQVTSPTGVLETIRSMTQALRDIWLGDWSRGSGAETYSEFAQETIAKNSATLKRLDEEIL